MSIQVGDLFKLRTHCMGNDAGIVGVCCDTYDLGEGPAGQIIFPNGEYDGFSPNEQEVFLEKVGHCPDVAGYQFVHVIKLSRDFRAGVFNKALNAQT